MGYRIKLKVEGMSKKEILEQVLEQYSYVSTICLKCGAFTVHPEVCTKDAKFITSCALCFEPEEAKEE